MIIFEMEKNKFICTRYFLILSKIEKNIFIAMYIRRSSWLFITFFHVQIHPSKEASGNARHTCF